MVKLIRHLFLLAIYSHALPFNFLPWYSYPKNWVILVKNITNSGCWVNQYCILLASAGNISLGLWPRPILLLRSIKYNIGLLTIHYLYTIWISMFVVQTNLARMFMLIWKAGPLCDLIALPGWLVSLCSHFCQRWAVAFFESIQWHHFAEASMFNITLLRQT